MTAPVTLNPFFAEILAQLVAYVTSHVEEIIALLLKLLGGEPTDEVKQAASTFRNSPTETNFNAFVASLTKAGADTGQIAATIVNKTNVSLPAKK